MKELVNGVKSFLGSMEDGDMSISAYDTAWVALIQDTNQTGSTPQFPCCLDWIAHNQLSDGSWGDPRYFLLCDRILNTLACVIALKTWNIHPHKCQRGISFLNEKMSMLEKENEEHFLGGFEIVFPSILEMARKLGIQLPDDHHTCSALQNIIFKRNLKLTRISKEGIYNVPTTVLFSLEGLQDMDLDWEKILKMQSKDGSFLSSPSSTAYAYLQTKDQNCFKYLNKVVQRFNGAAPTMYPVDLYERLWTVDRLERLGITRFFKREIEEYMNHVHRCWTEDGISWSSNFRLHDIDDTSMGFYLLRLYGYEVSPDAFGYSTEGKEFRCYLGQWNEAISVMFNLYRASQMLFSGEKILQEAKKFASKFLSRKREANRFLDKWIILKDLAGEIGLALDVPWYASLPRVQARFYVDQYGAGDVVHIGKTLFREPFIDNDMYLHLAKLDYNYCQSLHQIEWNNIQKWYEGFKLGDLGVSTRSLLCAYFMCAASIFEPERRRERLAWAKTAILVETIASYFDKADNSTKQRMSFLREFQKCKSSRQDTKGIRLETNDTTQLILIWKLLETLDQFSLDALEAYDQDITHHLYHSWEKWLLTWQEGVGRGEEAELMVQTINLMAGHKVSEESSKHGPFYERLFNLVNKICCQLYNHRQSKYKQEETHDNGRDPAIIVTSEIEQDMQQLVQMVLNHHDGINFNMKQVFLLVTKTFYCNGFIHPKILDSHIAKVLFERVD
ncbi:(-)-kolavenyl diphosphate synthase TPS28, chloroplastic-like [Tripterygium wilfordii]|uniref:(-)-kolavenyl diphosphate synthase TPS28, chloroplastic-like n=1 Tax=Tripterygium wilfordii TaxID=458696 RepID=UPI0018F7F0A2|nr:(-)-kolavenyl diphosphate synthase TPS28, chloroplastic-like [Tripterygium wilfordii]